MAAKQVAILGGSGFVAGELLRLFQEHPEVTVAFISSESKAGIPVGRVMPALRALPLGRTLRFSKLESLPEVDIVFSCLPQGVLPRHLELVRQRTPLLLNLAGDYRLRDEASLQEHYPASLAFPYPEAAYIIPELHPDISRHNLINLPGCMAVCTIYALYPLCRHDLIEDEVVADLKTGSSGGGKGSAEHAAERAHNFRVHKLHGHRHGVEIVEALQTLAGRKIALQFSTHSLDLPRGIFATVYTTLREGVVEVDVSKAYLSTYRDCRFVRFFPPALHVYPMLKTVLGTNCVDLGFSLSHQRCVVVACLDNLIKGAAGQAVQTMNRFFGFAEDLALTGGGYWP